MTCCVDSSVLGGRCQSPPTTLAYYRNGFGGGVVALCEDHFRELYRKGILYHPEVFEPADWADDGKWIGGDKEPQPRTDLPAVAPVETMTVNVSMSDD